MLLAAMCACERLQPAAGAPLLVTAIASLPPCCFPCPPAPACALSQVPTSPGMQNPTPALAGGWGPGQSHIDVATGSVSPTAPWVLPALAEPCLFKAGSAVVCGVGAGEAGGCPVERAGGGLWDPAGLTGFVYILQSIF